MLASSGSRNGRAIRDRSRFVRSQVQQASHRTSCWPAAQPRRAVAAAAAPLLPAAAARRAVPDPGWILSLWCVKHCGTGEAEGRGHPGGCCVYISVYIYPYIANESRTWQSWLRSGLQQYRIVSSGSLYSLHAPSYSALPLHAPRLRGDLS